MGDQVADPLGKGGWKQVETIWPQGVQWTGKRSRVFATWIEKPKVMLELGRRLLLKLSERLDVHVGRDYRLDMRKYDGFARGGIVGY